MRGSLILMMRKSTQKCRRRKASRISVTFPSYLDILPLFKTGVSLSCLHLWNLVFDLISMVGRAKEPDFDVTEMTPLQELIYNGFLEPGQPLYFRYQPEKGRERKFVGAVRPGGILVNRRIYSVSFAAIQCIKSLGDKTAINGWIAWQNSEGDHLSELYQQMRGFETPPRRSKKFKEQFYKNPRTRDVVFIFGAGASDADGAPLQKDLLPSLLTTSTAELLNSEPYRMVVEFLSDNFIWSEKAGRFPALENRSSDSSTTSSTSGKA